MPGKRQGFPKLPSSGRPGGGGEALKPGQTWNKRRDGIPALISVNFKSGIPKPFSREVGCELFTRQKYQLQRSIRTGDISMTYPLLVPRWPPVVEGLAIEVQT
jgi:hypothetical protein